MTSTERERQYRENEERRMRIIEYHKDDIPYLEDAIYKHRPFDRDDYKMMAAGFLQKQKQNDFRNLLTSINDIRNNTTPVSDVSNTIKNFDNKYSNEIKQKIKILLDKGYSYNETVFELEKVYGTGMLTTKSFVEKKPFWETFFVRGFLYSIVFLNAGVVYKLFKLIKKR